MPTLSVQYCFGLPSLLLIVTIAQITESVFNFSKAVPVVNQSRQEVRQPGFLAIIGLKLADGRPPSWKYKMDKYKYKYNEMFARPSSLY